MQEVQNSLGLAEFAADTSNLFDTGVSMYRGGFFSAPTLRRL